MATKNQSVTAGKTAWFVGLMALVSAIAYVDFWSTTDYWGAGISALIIQACMALAVMAVLAIALGETWLTGYYQAWSIVRELMMTVVICTGLLAATWMWTQQHAYFYLVFFGTIVCDTAAQLGGRWWPRLTGRWVQVRDFGSIRPRLLTHVSGGKTLGGFACGTVLSGAFMIIGLGVCVAWLGVPFVWGLAIVVPLGATGGDLFASWVKRGMKADDFYLLSSDEGLLGSHGGLLDRIDSHLCAQILAAALILGWPR